MQEIECKECKETIYFDDSEEVVTEINESRTYQSSSKKEMVVAYLTCVNGHTRPYKVKV
ncbi:MAG: hypothetical protein ACJA1C_002171 [Crocinitomicaceae bacterium]|jgi:hypothetical protein